LELPQFAEVTGKKNLELPQFAEVAGKKNWSFRKLRKSREKKIGASANCGSGRKM
jgi:hypothetical protein